MNKIKVRNEKIWEHQNNQRYLDTWLLEHVGFGNWTEHFEYEPTPYRIFSFKIPTHETEFILKWL